MFSELEIMNFCVYTTFKRSISIFRCYDTFIKPYMVVFILDMKTKEKYRGKGYMGNILDAVKRYFGGSVKFILTNYHDSSKEGIAFLKKRDFVHNKENSQLIWRRDAGTAKKPADEKEAKTDNGSGGEQPGEATT